MAEQDDRVPSGKDDDAGRKPRFDPKARIHVGYWLLAALVLMLLQNLWLGARDVQTVPYSRFVQLLQQGRISDVRIDAQTLTGTLKAGAPGKPAGQVAAVRVDPLLAAQLQRYGVPYAQVYQSAWLSDLLSWVVPALAFFGVWFFMVRRFADRTGGGLGGGFMAIGKSRAKVYMENSTGVTYADVA